jgi:hypothetical protein
MSFCTLKFQSSILVDFKETDMANSGQLDFGALNREMLGHSFAQAVILLAPVLALIRRKLGRALTLRRRRQKQEQMAAEAPNNNNNNNNGFPIEEPANALGSTVKSLMASTQQKQIPQTVLRPLICVECEQPAICAVRARERKGRTTTARRKAMTKTTNANASSTTSKSTPTSSSSSTFGSPFSRFNILDRSNKVDPTIQTTKAAATNKRVDNNDDENEEEGIGEEDEEEGNASWEVFCYMCYAIHFDGGSSGGMMQMEPIVVLDDGIEARRRRAVENSKYKFAYANAAVTRHF